MVIEYAKNLSASEEVLSWCETVLAARQKRQSLDRTEVEHIIDYLVSDAAPKRLRKMSYAQAKSGSEKWSKAQQKKGRDLVDAPGDLKTLHDFGDGTKIVKLLTKKAYQREGFLMAHCAGAYHPHSTTIYSYRDAANMPHATFEVTKSGGEITQIKGKGNGSIHPKYINPILTFLRAIGTDIRPSDMKNLGYHYIKPEVRGVLEQFVDGRGKGPEFVEIAGVEYMVAG